MPKHSQESAIEKTKTLFREYPEETKRDIQMALMVQQGTEMQIAKDLSERLYIQALESPEASFSFGPYFGMDGDDPQWNVGVSVGGITAKLLAGLDEDTGSTYILADGKLEDLKRVKAQLEAT